MIQCDWISAKTVSDTPHQYDTGLLVRLGPGGSYLGESRSAVMVDDNEPSSSRVIRAYSPDDRTLWISGNPSKIVNDGAHNLWGSGDIGELYFQMGQFVRQHAGLFPSPATYKANHFSGPLLSRVDLTRSYRFPTHKEAQEFIRYAAGSARSRHGAAKLYGSETAYFGQKSTRWTMKIYDKATEFSRFLRKFREVASVLHFPHFQEWADGVVRFELTLRTPELKKLPYLPLLSDSELQTIWDSYFDRIEWTDNAMNPHDLPLENLPPKMLPVFRAWQSGDDLRACYPHNTFYRYRRQILDAIGVDITLPPADLADGDSRPAKSPLKASGWDPEPLLPVYTASKSLKELYELTAPCGF